MEAADLTVFTMDPKSIGLTLFPNQLDENGEYLSIEAIESVKKQLSKQSVLGNKDGLIVNKETSELLKNYLYMSLYNGKPNGSYVGTAWVFTMQELFEAGLDLNCDEFTIDGCNVAYWYFDPLYQRVVFVRG